MKTIISFFLIAATFAVNAVAQENSVLRFVALAGDRLVELSWETRNESDLFGFVLLRANGDSSNSFSEITHYNSETALVARGTEGFFSRRYSWNDRGVDNDNRYWYKLKLVAKDDSTKILSALAATPTAQVVLYQASENFGWTWQNPLPTGNYIKDIAFVDADHGWMVGEQNTILRTIDGGRSWQFLDSGVKGQDGEWPAEVLLEQVHFFDHQHGVIGGYLTSGAGDGTAEDFILRTNDGGDSWQITFRLQNYCCYWLDMFFFDDRLGWLSLHSKGLFRTTDGGFNWEKVSDVPPPFFGSGAIVHPGGIRKLFFLTPDTGWGAFGVEAVFYTNNSGRVWTRKAVPEFHGVCTAIAFTNRNEGWMANEHGKIYRTTDAGGTWHLEQEFGTLDLRDIAFLDHQTGFLLAKEEYPKTGGTIFKTADNGRSWQSQYFAERLSLYRINIADAQNLWITGRAANAANRILRSNDRGENWQPLESGPAAHIAALQFVTLDSGWALGGVIDSVGREHVVILRTTNGGRNWELQTSLPSVDPSAMSMLDAQRGIVVTGLYTVDGVVFDTRIFSTRDGWETWRQTDVLDVQELFDTQLLDSQHGWVCGSNGLLMLTEDGGDSWQRFPISSPETTSTSIRSFHFFDASFGKAFGQINSPSMYAGVVWETRDGGRSWRQIWQAADMYPEYTVFVDSLHGWIASGENSLFHTSDGGHHWQRQNPNLPIESILSMTFLDGLQGWALGARGNIIHTSDGGLIWNKLQRFSDEFRAITFLDPSHGWIAGSRGKIAVSSSGGVAYGRGTSVEEHHNAELVPEPRLYQNYPNPFNPSTVIRYELRRPGKLTLTIFNVLGQQVRALIDGDFKAPGVHTVQWNGKNDHGHRVTTGIYFYRLEIDGSVVYQKKMILLR